MQVMLVFGRQSRHPSFPDAPLATEVARSAADKRLIEVLEVPYLLSRPYAAPPEVPADRAKALQAAFLAAQKDSDYLADAQKLQIDVSPIGSDQAVSLINRIAELPEDQLNRLEKVVQGGD